MNIKQESEGNIVILSLVGRLDTMNHPLLENELNMLMENKLQHIVLDCQDLDYVSSSGLRVLLKALKQFDAISGRFIICSLQPQIVQIFRISGFDKLFELFPGRKEALASFI